MHGLNEELGIIIYSHRGRDDTMECSLYGDECENESCFMGVFSIINLL